MVPILFFFNRIKYKEIVIVSECGFLWQKKKKIELNFRTSSFYYTARGSEIIWPWLCNAHQLIGISSIESSEMEIHISGHVPHSVMIDRWVQYDVFFFFYQLWNVWFWTSPLQWPTHILYTLTDSRPKRHAVVTAATLPPRDRRSWACRRGPGSCAGLRGTFSAAPWWSTGRAWWSPTWAWPW